jgi:hypothetical protein
MLSKFKNRKAVDDTRLSYHTNVGQIIKTTTNTIEK